MTPAAELLAKGFVVVVGLFLSVSPLYAQTQSRPQTIPDLSGVWEAPNELNSVRERSDICDAACDESIEAGFNPYNLITTIEEPQLLPWAEEKYKVTERVLGRNRRGEINPWFTGCIPASPSWLTLNPFIAVEVRQFPDAVFLFYLYTADHTVRRIYMDGRGHPPNLKPTWNGHSIGHYDGDTLVVDTIGLTGGARWLDFRGHPHSDALHLVERIRRLDDKSLEFEVTITDPTAYANSWSKKTVRQLAPPGPRIWEGTNCEELLQMGTHFGAEARGED